MPRRDDEIFKKLKNEKPLAKSAGEKSDASDGDGKNTFELMVEKKTAKRKKPVGTRGVYRTPKKRGDRTVVVTKSKAAQKKEIEIFSEKSPSSQRAKDAKRDISDERDMRAAEAAREETHAKAEAPPKREQAPSKPAETQKDELIFDAPEKPEPVRKAQTSKPKAPDRAPAPSRAPEPRARQDKPKTDMGQDKPLADKPQPSRPAAKKNAAASKSDAQISLTKTKKVFRHELKYYINYKDYYLLRASVGAVMSLDENADENGKYHIRSLYFDDIYERALAEKVAGNDNRCKYRVRIYDYKDDMIKLERKQKHGHFIKKSSMLMTKDEYEGLIAGDLDFLLARKSSLAKEMYVKMKSDLLRPRVIVDYTREAYVHPIEDVRVTFDIDLKGSTMMSDIFDESIPCMPVYEHGKMVLEVKFNRYLPESIKCALSSAKAMQRSAISKYVLCRKFD